jgi:mono/diheme cytochrome c family protein
MVVSSCGKDYHRNPGKIYAPDMTYSRAYDYYNTTDSINNSGASFNKMPVKGTIAREQGLPTHFGVNDTTAAYSLVNPYTLYAKDLEHGKRMYLIHCGVCHGEKLDGQGPLYTSEKYIAAPANLIGANYVNFTQGKIYHAIMFGKNMMGSYASQLDPKERWQVIAYIKSVQAENGGAAFNMISEEPTNVVEATEEAGEQTTEEAPKMAH